MSDSKWFGDSTDGIEVRYEGEGDDRILDEIVLYRGGKCCFHLEMMSDTTYWMSLISERFEVHANVFSKRGKAHISANADGWPNE